MGSPTPALLLACLLATTATTAELLQAFEVEEGVAVGVVVGTVGQAGPAGLPAPPYLIVPQPGSNVDRDLAINSNSGEIRTKRVLDREETDSYTFNAIPLNGESIRVRIDVKDVNDNAPSFPAQAAVDIDIPENTPMGTKRKLPKAIDPDLGQFGTQRYDIVSGNVDEAFSVSFDRASDNVDLIVSQNLDRERVPAYELVVVASDGGSPALTGAMTVRVRVLDLNDEGPRFERQRYFTSISADAPVGSSVIRVRATDADDGDNGRVAYVINRRQSDRQRFFNIDKDSGVVTLQQRLDFDSDVHEIVVVARDGGDVPQETSAFITVRVAAAGQPTGDSTEDYGEEERLTTAAVSATTSKSMPTAAPTSAGRRENSNAPVFENPMYAAELDALAPIGSRVIRVQAFDSDQGESGRIRYSLQEANATDHFAIDSATGDITTRVDLECQMERAAVVVVTATDHGLPPKSSTTKVSVALMQGQSVPAFEKAFYEVSLPEDSPTGSCFLKVLASGSECGSASSVSYSLKDASLDFVSVEPSSGEICLLKQIDFERNAVVDFVVVAADKGGQSASTVVRINVEDVNDNKPVFRPAEYKAKIRSRFPVESTILTVLARDADFGPAGSVVYEIDSGNEDGQFHIDPQSGKISLATPLPSLHPEAYFFSVKATDGLGLSSESSAEVQISVDDNLDFEATQYVFEVVEDVSPYSEVGHVRWQSGEGRLSVYAASDHGLVSVDVQSGLVRTEARLDFETSPVIVLNVKLQQAAANAESYCQVILMVQDVNDNAPEFSSSSATVALREDAPVGDTVYKCSARDVDSGLGGAVSFRLTQNPGNLFAVDRSSGAVSLLAPIDYESAQTHALVVEATDEGKPPLASHFKLHLVVTDVNDNDPVFERDRVEVEIAHNLQPGAPIATLTATDSDSGRNAKISYFAVDNSYNLAVSRSNGTLFLQKSLELNSLEKGTIEVEILARDHGHPSREAKAVVSLTVKHQASKLSFDKDSYAFQVGESVAEGAYVGSVRVAGEHESVTYELVEESGRFRIEKDSGRITASESLSWSSSPTHELLVQAKTVSGDAANVKVLVSLQHQEQRGEQTFDHPQLQEPEGAAPRSKTLMVDAAVEAGTKIGELGGAGDGQHAYVIESGSDEAVRDLFLVDLPTGDVYVLAPLTSSAKAAYVFGVTVSSLRGDSAPRHIDVTVKVRSSLGSELTFLSDPVHVHIREDAAVGSEVVSVALLVDVHKVGNVTFELVEQYPSPILETHLRGLILAKNLDFESESEYFVRLRGVTSGGRATADVTVHVSVDDVNDNGQIFLSSSEVAIASDTPLNAPVMKVLVRDLDAGANGRVSLSLEQDGADGVFQLKTDTSELVLTGRPTRSNYELVLKAEDSGDVSGRLRAQQTVRVNVLGDLSESSPRFEQSVYYANTTENLDADTMIITLPLRQMMAEKDELVYTLLKGQDKFYVDAPSREIRTLSPLDREQEDAHMIVVSIAVKDSPGITDTAVVYVSVGDINDSDPTFGQNCHNLSVPENAINFMHTFVASDADDLENGKVIYSLSAAANSDKFSIDKNTGRMQVASLDREARDSYEVEIVATDGGSSPRSSKCAIRVTVLDENDSEPTFSQSIYSASVKEDVTTGLEVLRVVASDADMGDNAKIFYSIDNTSELFFAIDKDTGAILTTSLLDRESIGEHRFDVVATDQGSESIHSSRTQVRIIVVDANDHTPAFAEFPFRLNMSSKPTSGVPLLRLLAHDPDFGPNGQLTFNIVRPDKRERFQLSPDEGILTVSASSDFSWEPGTIEVLEIAVSDAGNPPRSSTGLVEIKIDGGPSVLLAFQQQVYNVELAENPHSGADVLQVKAVRTDGRRQRVTYTFQRGNENGAFDINSNNGLIRVRDAELIDAERQDQFNLTVSAQGLGDDELFAYTTVVVKVTDVNDNAPKFRELPPFHVEEGLRKGSLVTVLTAIDLDKGQTGALRYDIVDGNVDGAFAMAPNQPGALITNTVLDREIRNKYVLTVSATDSGVPPLVGLAQVVISVLDVNDNQPYIAPPQPIIVTADSVPGTVLTIIRANDIDLTPAVTYSFEEESDVFAVDTYSGQIVLLKKPSSIDPLTVTSSLVIIASDTVHKVKTSIPVKLESKKARICRPVFSEALYTFYYSSNDTFPLSVGQVDASECGDLDSITYEMKQLQGVKASILYNGTVVLNAMPTGDISTFVVSAESGISKHKDESVVVVERSTSSITGVDFATSEDSFVVMLNNDISALKSRTSILKVGKENAHDLYYSITKNRYVDIDSVSGDIFQLSMVDSSFVPEEALVSAQRIGSRRKKTKPLRITFEASSASVSRAYFVDQERLVELIETAEIGTQIEICSLSEPSSGLNIRIVSGNEHGGFAFDQHSSQLKLTKALDFEQKTKMHLVLLILGSKDRNLCRVNINVLDDNDNVPFFPVASFVVSVSENMPIGTAVATLPAIDADKTDTLTFFLDESSSFEIDAIFGLLRTREVFDYERISSYDLVVSVNDSAGHRAECNVRVLIASQDEFAPVFVRSSYFFSLSGQNDKTPLAAVGDVLGSVQATDKDGGSDGVVGYSMSTPNSYFGVDPLRGTVSVLRPLDTGLLELAANDDHLATNHVLRHRRRRAVRDVHLVITARSNQPNSLEASTSVYVSVEEAALPIAADLAGGSMPAWAQGILVGFILVVIVIAVVASLYCRRKRLLLCEKMQKSKTSVQDHGNTNLGIELSSAGSESMSRFPPQYSEIISDYSKGRKTNSKPRSDISEKSQRSASSGRGSVEDGDDEVDVEIRMINEGSCYLSPANVTTDNNSLLDEDKLSNGSIQNTEEYLARLGIDVRRPPNVTIGGDLGHNFEGSHVSTGSAIYNLIPDDALSERNSVLSVKRGAGGSLLYGSRSCVSAVLGAAAMAGHPSLTGSLSSIVHSEEELAGSYNWDYLLDWGPQYQPLAHVFKEISRLKDDPSGPSSSAVPMSAPPPDLVSLSPTATATASLSVLSPLRNRHTSHLFLPRSTRSPVSHDQLLSQNALSPSFHPSLSPLAAKSPSVSPLAVPLQRTTTNAQRH